MTQPIDQASTADLNRYAIHYEPLFNTLQAIDVQQLIDTVTEPWYNQTLIQVGDVLVRLGVMQGEYHWHKHDEQDEFFYVLQGEFHIELEGREMRLCSSPTKPSAFRPACCTVRLCRSAAQ
jgi:uncharacterized cupin superfamily protein